MIPILSRLSEEEMEIFLHMVKNKRRSMNAQTLASDLLIDEACSDDLKKKFAKLSEEENFALKNTFKHQQDTMRHADKKRMPIDKSKVRDLLRHQNLFKEKIVDEIGTYYEQ